MTDTFNKQNMTPDLTMNNLWLGPKYLILGNPGENEMMPGIIII